MFTLWLRMYSQLILRFIIFLSFLSAAECLTLSHVTVPQYKTTGESAQLKCPFELERNQRDRLYAIKWYKDNEEFFRYVPKYTPPIYTHKIDGVNVQLSGSNDKQVTLTNLDLSSTGVYRCEVSAEAPSFASVSGEGRMTVIHLPGGPPQINGTVKEEYEVGDELNFTCSARKSYPPVKLSWYINDVPVSEEYFVDLTPKNLGNSLTPAMSQLKLKLEVDHFTEDGKTKIVCKGKQFSWENPDNPITLSPIGARTLGPTKVENPPFPVARVHFERDTFLELKGISPSIHAGSIWIYFLVSTHYIYRSLFEYL